MARVAIVSCNYCLKDHHFVCNCGHPHDHHLFAGPCKRLKCSCQQYDQSGLRLPGETVKEWMKRTLSRRKYAEWWDKEKKKIADSQLQICRR